MRTEIKEGDYVYLPADSPQFGYVYQVIEIIWRADTEGYVSPRRYRIRRVLRDTCRPDAKLNYTCIVVRDDIAPMPDMLLLARIAAGEEAALEAPQETEA